MIYQFIIVFILFLAQFVESTNNQLIISGDCNGFNKTCSPIWCQRVSNPACNITQITKDADALVKVQLSINTLGCQVCKQQPINRCSTSYLRSILIKSK